MFYTGCTKTKMKIFITVQVNELITPLNWDMPRETKGKLWVFKILNPVKILAILSKSRKSQNYVRDEYMKFVDNTRI